MNTSIDAHRTPAFKASMRAQWDTAAAGWNAHAADIRAWLRRPTDAMCRMAGVTAGRSRARRRSRLGRPDPRVAERVGPRGRVLATDLSPAIVALAATTPPAPASRNVETQVADGEDLRRRPRLVRCRRLSTRVDVLSRSAAGVREMHRALRPGGGVCTMVFSRPERNPCVTILMATALEHAGLPPRDPRCPAGLLSLGQPGRIDALFREAGFHDVATTRDRRGVPPAVGR